MENFFLDNSLILSVLFRPRPAQPGTNHLDNVIDGAIEVEENVVLGYRMYVHDPTAPIVLLFHGNSEIAPDYDDAAPMYHHAGVSLMVVDYRGYGWSTGRPLVSTLLSDAEVVYECLPSVFTEAIQEGSPLIVMGRSLGSACAIELAIRHPGALKGLIIESGFAHVVPLLSHLGMPTVDKVHLSDPINNIGKITLTSVPLLVIHGEEDALIPVEEGQALHDSSPATIKRLKRIPSAGHNDLLNYAEEYFVAVEEFIVTVTR